MAIFGFKSRSCFIDLVPTQPRSEGDWVVSPPTHDGLYAIVGQVPGWRCISPSCLGHEQSIVAKASITHGKGWVGGQSSLCAMKLVICKMQVQQTKHIASKIYPTVLRNALTFAGAPPKTLANSILGADPGLERVLDTLSVPK